MNHGRFTECCFLRSIGRELLAEFFQRFQTELSSRQLVLPGVDASDDAFFTGLSRLLLSPEGLPDRVNEVLHEIQELSTEAGHDRLRAAVAATDIQLPLDLDATREEMALRVWLEAPDLLVKQYSEHRFSKLKAFVFYERDTGCLPLQRDFEKRANESVLVAHLDNWFGANARGSETALVEKFQLNGEEWYLIRHGDTYHRSSRIEKRKVEVVHYRPAQDDLVVYNPQRDELRINTKTKGERELYRAAFGQYLHGFENYFRATETYSLDPLKQLGLEALACGDISGIRKVVLTQLEMEVGLDGMKPFTNLWKGKNLFECMGSREGYLPIPLNAKLVEAVFRIYLTGSKPINVKICAPNEIRVENKQWAAGIVQDWLVARGFKGSTPVAMAAAA